MSIIPLEWPAFAAVVAARATLRPPHFAGYATLIGHARFVVPVYEPWSHVAARAGQGPQHA